MVQAQSVVRLGSWGNGNETHSFLASTPCTHVHVTVNMSIGMVHWHVQTNCSDASVIVCRSVMESNAICYENDPECFIRHQNVT
jgi:hypothetical protein